MSQTLLNISNLHVLVETGEEILKGLNLVIKEGETHVIMGPNGAGKSTLANVIMGHPAYTVAQGAMRWRAEDLTALSTDERARQGLFMSFQAPEEIDGITMRDFIKSAKAAIDGAPTSAMTFRRQLEETMALLEMDASYGERYVNLGFSGGEKKKSEILQMLMLQPKLAILDETDSGLDVDAVKTVTAGVMHYQKPDRALLIISHSTRLLEDMAVDYVHILVDGKIITTGGKDLIYRINQDGFAGFIG